MKTQSPLSRCSLAVALQVPDLALLDSPDESLLWTSHHEEEIAKHLTQYLDVEFLRLYNAPRVQEIFTELLNMAVHTLTDPGHHDEKAWLAKVGSRCAAFRTIDPDVLKAVLKSLVRRRRRYQKAHPGDEWGTSPLGRAVQAYMVAKNERDAVKMMARMDFTPTRKRRAPMDEDDELMEEVPAAKKGRGEMPMTPESIDSKPSRKRRVPGDEDDELGDAVPAAKRSKIDTTYSPSFLRSTAASRGHSKTPLAFRSPRVTRSQTRFSNISSGSIASPIASPSVQKKEDAVDVSHCTKNSLWGAKSGNFLVLTTSEQDTILDLAARTPLALTRAEVLALPTPVVNMMRRSAGMMEVLAARRGDAGKSAVWDAVCGFLAGTGETRDEEMEGRGMVRRDGDGCEAPEGWVVQDWMFWVVAHLQMFVLE